MIKTTHFFFITKIDNKTGKEELYDNEDALKNRAMEIIEKRVDAKEWNKFATVAPQIWGIYNDTSGDYIIIEAIVNH